MKMPNLLLLSLLGAAAFVGPASAQNANPYQFKKEAFKPDGTPWTGPVHIGDVIKYVLSYKPGTTNSGPVTIVDKLSPNQSYVAPTKASDALWTWGTSPYSTANTETYSHPGFGPGTGKVKVTVTGAPTPASGTGDGTIPIPIQSLNKVFGVFHHAASATEGKIDCWDLTTLAKCGTAQPNAIGTFLNTPYTPQAVVRGTTIFFLGYRASAGGAVSIGCYDGAAQTACADIPLPATVANMGALAGLVEDGTGRAFASVKDKVFCRVLPAGTNCAGWPASGLVSITSATNPTYHLNVQYVSMEFGPSPTRLYIHHGNAVIQCIDINLAAPCAGSWTSAGTKIAGQNDGIMLSSLPLSGSSGDGGVCLWKQPGGQVGCLSNLGTATSSTPNNVSAAALSTFRLPNSGKVFFPTHGSGGPKCFDYSGTTGGACGGFSSPTPPPNGLQYGFALDPLDPAKCMLTLGDKNVLWRFDYNTGKIGCGTTTVTTPKIEDLYCHGTPNPATFRWNSIRVLTSGGAGTLQITQGTNAPISQTVSFGTTTPMPGGVGPGFAPLSFYYVPNPGTPTTVDLEIGFVSDKNPQICYQAVVKSCGPVFNDAVFKGNFNGSPVTVSQRVDLGKVVGGDCSPTEITGCLKDMKVAVKCNPDGTYTVTLNGPGSPGTELALTSQTPGVTVTPQKQPWAATTTWTLVGATPGQPIKLTATATQVGGGSEPGSDLCCSAEIVVTMPDCPKPVDVAIGKENTAQGGSGKWFNLWVTNVGAPITFPAGGLTVTDNIPAGMTVTHLTGTGTNWTCGPPPPPPLAGPAALTCTYNAAGTLATNASLSGSILVHYTTTGPGPFTNCATIGIKPAVGVDANPANDTACVTVTTTPESCPPPMVIGAIPGVCVCPPGTMQQGKECVKQPAVCPPPLVAGAIPGVCVCPPGTTQQGKECVKQPAACPPPMVQGPVPGICVCPPGTTQKGRECVRTIVCQPPLVPNKTSTACICPPGTELRGRECVRPTVCNAPAKLNRRGVCECPADMVAQGNTCVPRKPSVTPGDVIRGLPGLLGPGRGEPSGPRPGGSTPGAGPRP